MNLLNVSYETIIVCFVFYEEAICTFWLPLNNFCPRPNPARQILGMLGDWGCGGYRSFFVLSRSDSICVTVAVLIN